MPASMSAARATSRVVAVVVGDRVMEPARVAPVVWAVAAPEVKAHQAQQERPTLVEVEVEADIRPISMAVPEDLA